MMMTMEREETSLWQDLVEAWERVDRGPVAREEGKEYEVLEEDEGEERNDRIVLE